MVITVSQNPVRVISHRCLGFGLRENSAAALHTALRSGVDEVELDFRVTNDRELVASHFNLYLDELRFPRLVSHRSLLQNQRSGLMSLAECCEMFQNHGNGKRLRLEIKSSGVEEAVVRALTTRGILDRVVVVSWRASSLRRFRELAPSLELGLSFIVGLQGHRFPPLTWSHCVPEALHDPKLQIRSVNVVRGLIAPTADFIAKLRSLNIEVFTLSKGARADIDRLKELGVTGALFSSLEGLPETTAPVETLTRKATA